MKSCIQKTLFHAIAACALIAGAACSTSQKYADKASTETYGILSEKTAMVPGMEADFSIEQDATWDPLEGLSTTDVVDEFLGPNAESEVGAKIISLEKALEFAVKGNRGYQTRKESLFLRALALTLERHRYTPIFSGSVVGDLVGDTTDIVGPSNFAGAVASANAVINQLEAMTGTPAQVLQAYADLVESAGILLDAPQTSTDIVDERRVQGATNVGVDLLLKGGGRIAMDLTSNFLRFLTGDPSAATSSVLSASFTQPLLRGAGAKVAAERLTQAERDVLYALRDFTRFRQEFVVQICSAYYRVLQDRDIVKNNWGSYQSFEHNAERERNFAAEGRSTIAAVGRQEQGVLSAQNSWINALRRYKEDMDQFKIQLGISTDADIVLDDRELQILREQGLQHPNISTEDSVKVALVSRLDLYVVKDQTDDAGRRVLVAANALKPGLDLITTAQMASTGQDNFQELDFNRPQWRAGLDLDLPFERTAERNAYRAALIAQEQSLRDFSLAVDNVKFEVRSAWRDLEQALRNYEISKTSVELNRRRVEEQELLADVGRGSTLDQVDATINLTESENNLTAALVAHAIAKLTFWRDAGILYIKKNGQWEEVDDSFQPAQDLPELSGGEIR